MVGDPSEKRSDVEELRSWEGQAAQQSRRPQEPPRRGHPGLRRCADGGHHRRRCRSGAGLGGTRGQPCRHLRAGASRSRRQGQPDRGRRHPGRRHADRRPAGDRRGRVLGWRLVVGNPWRAGRAAGRGPWADGAAALEPGAAPAPGDMPTDQRTELERLIGPWVYRDEDAPMPASVRRYLEQNRGAPEIDNLLDAYDPRSGRRKRTCRSEPAVASVAGLTAASPPRTWRRARSLHRWATAPAGRGDGCRTPR